MKIKIGSSEGISAIIIFSLSLPLFLTVSSEAARLTSGAWINAVICCLVNVILVSVSAKFFLKFGNESFSEITNKLTGKIFGFLITVLISALIFTYILYIYDVSTKKIAAVGASPLNLDLLKIVLLSVAVFVCLCNIEALSRLSFVISFFVFLLIGILIIITLNGFNTDNFFPLLGSDAKVTFVPGIFLSSNIGLVLLMINSRFFKNKTVLVTSVKRIVIWSSLFNFILILWFTLTVPHSLVSGFEGGIEAVFASSVAGKFFRRFEIFMMALYVFIQVITVAAGLFSLARLLSDGFNISDYRPFALILGILIYNLNGLSIEEKFIRCVCYFLWVITFLLPTLYIIISKIKDRKKKTG